MEIRNLITFMQIVEAGSFTTAADLLGYTQSTVSFQIRQLEEELGCQLFDRYNHIVTLTDKGHLLLTYAQQVTRDIDTLKDSFNSEDKPEGVVRVVLPDSICERMLLENYHTFHEEYPGIRLVFATANTVDMMRMLDRHEADVIFPLDFHTYRKEYVIAKEAPVQLHFVTSASSPLAKRKKLKIEDLLDRSFILTEKGMSYRKILDERLAEASLVIEPVLETGRTDIITSVLAEGNEISYLPDFVTEEAVKSGKLVYLHVDGYDLTIWKQLIYHRDKWVSRPLAAFLDFVIDHEFAW